MLTKTEIKRSHMVPLIFRSEGPNLATVRVQRGQIKIGSQWSDNGEVASGNWRCINLAANFLRPKHFAIRADSKDRTRFCGKEDMVVLDQRTGSNRAIRLNGVPVQAAS